jgi:zona occludens toxin (predicted ATPase)
MQFTCLRRTDAVFGKNVVTNIYAMELQRVVEQLPVAAQK